MKLDSYILLICLLLYSLFGTAQTGPHEGGFELFISAGTKLETVLNDFTEKYGLEFSYPSQLGETKIHRNRDLKHESLSDFLTDLFSSSGIGFQIENTQKVLLRKESSPSGNSSAINLTGQIKDAESSIPLPYVMIYSLTNPNQGTLTDQRGYYNLTISQSKLSEKMGIRLLGYETLELSGQELLEDPNLSLKIKPFLLSEIPIEENFPEFSFNRDNLSLGIHNKGASSPSDLLGNDALRNLQLLPGISSDNDLSAGVRIRGSDSDETLIVLDGIPIYKAEHFFGVFSSINSQYVSDIQLYKNALPVEYGGRTGGMVLLSSDSKLDKWGSKIDVNALTASARLDIPIGRDGGFILQGRSTYSNAAESKIFNLFQESSSLDISSQYPYFARHSLLDVEPNFRFYDMNGKFFFRPTADQYIDVNFFHSKDRLNNRYSTKYNTLQNQLWVDNNEDFSQTNNWENTGFSVNYRNSFAPKFQVKSRLFFTDYFNENAIDVSYFQSFEENPIDWTMNNFFQNSITDIGGEMSLAYELSQKHQLQVGIGVTQHESQLFGSHTDILAFSRNDQGNELQLFGNYKISLEDWLINLGGRFTQYDITNEVFFSPRITLSHFVSPEFSIKSSFNQDYQFVRNITHENVMSQGLDFLILADGIDFPVGKVNNFMFGATYSKPNWSIDVEFFNKDLKNVIEHSLSIPGFSPTGGGACGSQCDYRFFYGDGRAIGMDLILYVQESWYSGTLAYTLSRNSQRFDDILEGVRFPADNDRRHQFKWTNTFSVDRFQFTGNFIFSSGRPFTDFSRLDRKKERIHIDPVQRITRLPDYQRIDLGVNYSFMIGGLQASTGFSVFNLTNHQNVKYYQYYYSIPARDGSNRNHVIGNQTNMLSRTFNLSVKLDI